MLSMKLPHHRQSPLFKSAHSMTIACNHRPRRLRHDIVHSCSNRNARRRRVSSTKHVSGSTRIAGHSYRVSVPLAPRAISESVLNKRPRRSGARYYRTEFTGRVLFARRRRRAAAMRNIGSARGASPHHSLHRPRAGLHHALVHGLMRGLIHGHFRGGGQFGALHAHIVRFRFARRILLCSGNSGTRCEQRCGAYHAQNFFHLRPRLDIHE